MKWTSPFSSSGLLGVVFHSYQNFNRELDQTLQSVASDLGLYYLSMSHKKNARIIWVKYFCFIIMLLTSIVLFLHRTG